MKVLVNKGTLLSEVRPLLLFATVSQTSWECGWRERCITCGSTCMVQESAGTLYVSLHIYIYIHICIHTFMYAFTFIRISVSS